MKNSNQLSRITRDSKINAANIRLPTSNFTLETKSKREKINFRIEETIDNFSRKRAACDQLLIPKPYATRRHRN